MSESRWRNSGAEGIEAMDRFADLPSPSVEGGEPTTEAGRALVERARDYVEGKVRGSVIETEIEVQVRAIEAEARQPYEAAVAALERLIGAIDDKADLLDPSAYDDARAALTGATSPSDTPAAQGSRSPATPECPADGAVGGATSPSEPRLTVGTDRERPAMPPQHCECGRELPCFDHRAVGALPVPEAQKSTADLALQRSKSRHAAWCFLPADHDGACDGDQ